MDAKTYRAPLHKHTGMTVELERDGGALLTSYGARSTGEAGRFAAAISVRLTTFQVKRLKKFLMENVE